MKSIFNKRFVNQNKFILLYIIIYYSSIIFGLNISSNTINYPIFIFHGITSSNEGMLTLKNDLSKDGRIVHAVSYYNGWKSFTSLWKQVKQTVLTVREIIAESPDAYVNGYHFIGHSQGGIFARALIETMDEHKVHTFISLAGPQNGVYYAPYFDDRTLAEYLTILPKFIFRWILRVFRSGFLQDAVTTVFYWKWVQKCFSPANSWHTVSLVNNKKDGKFIKKNSFLPPLNNIETGTWDSLNRRKLLKKNNNNNNNNNEEFTMTEQDIVSFSSEEINLIKENNNNDLDKYYTWLNSTASKRKQNFIRIKKLVAFYSNEDEAIRPPISAGFGFYKDNQYTEYKTNKRRGKTIDWLFVPVNKTIEYINDTYGLQTLDRLGRMKVIQVSNIPHTCWTNSTDKCDHQELYENYIKKEIL